MKMGSHSSFDSKSLFQTSDDYFEGELANPSKNNARNMASHIFMQICISRKTCISEEYLNNF